eukprot:comp17252_c0_seq1/m.16310 comp17252_c0_seq1/g.16310  ORF comp17252_c0_seq1/g.16310 comp17252_c0_seq1/m.16310 type:complete len:462 (-) comp17252_c0_seq1:544-1929(-)
MADGKYVQAFLNYVNKSPSPFHAVEQSAILLRAAGYTEIKERDPFNIKPNGKYYFTRNRSTIIAFSVGGQYKQGNGFNIIGAHTDSPCPKLKPASELKKSGYLSVGVQMYGGGLWYTWVDRDLTVAGRVLVRNGDAVKHGLVHINRPIMRIPSLAIHLDRTVNDGLKLNTETQMVPVLAQAIKQQVEGETKAEGDGVNQTGKHHPLLLNLMAKELGCNASDILDFELCVADTVPACVGGAHEEFLFSPRLDNLMSSYCALQALIDSSSDAASLEKDPSISMICLFDHEEIGSQSAYGAGSCILNRTITRIVNATTPEQFDIAMAKSLLISADMAHAIHPNYAEKHEENHRPQINSGPVIKFNAQQRYATTALTANVLRALAKKHNVPVQDVCVRNDSPCGSTIGPILSANTGIRTVDIGNPQLSMHSCREMGGVDDVGHAINLFTAFFKEFSSMEQNFIID